MMMMMVTVIRMQLTHDQALTEIIRWVLRPNQWNILVPTFTTEVIPQPEVVS